MKPVLRSFIRPASTALGAGLLSGMFGFAAMAADPNAAQRLHDQLGKVGVQEFTAHDFHPGTVKHIVLFKFGNDVTEAQREEVADRFLAMQKTATRNGEPYIESIVVGEQNSGEGVAHGFEQGYVVTFASEGDRNYYVGAPIVGDPQHYDAVHQKFKEFVGPLLAKDNGVLVFDFTAESQDLTN